ncbi:DUF4249 domain-containing protein [Pedobacter sp. BMA]|uniref:DUF4249 domain-containing protein n=1 Tax=Pedobacter sp. BMA TaxID=1663685 RepID=UPI00064B4040|nr:DUF4249 domain-containing protein [Pedobacter sp. BMA]KLT66152.1 hypothetical protein AB669_08295 [Pedobacter sp. BMA]
MKQLIFILCIVVCFSSCKKIISIDTENAPPQIVIEAKINDRLIDQQIRITKTVGYTDASIYPTVSGATVSVSDSRGNNYVFRETAAGVYTNRMRGVYGVTYTMNVVAEGKTYTASSKMPNLVRMDSIGIISNTFFGNERKTTAAYLADPANETNFYRFTLNRNGINSNRIYVSNDRLTNGNKLRIQLYFNAEDDEDEDLLSGDKVAVEMEGIDSNVFDYWYALSSQSGRGPNQGTTPANPTSNISNDALGYFSVNTYQKITATVK